MRILTACFMALLLVGCGGGTQQPQAKGQAITDVSFSKHLQPIFSVNCMPCHSGGADAPSKYAVTSYEGVMGTGKDSIPNVLPGKPDGSLLCRMLKDGRMPPTGPLDAPKVELVGKWIAQGAKNN